VSANRSHKSFGKGEFSVSIQDRYLGTERLLITPRPLLRNSSVFASITVTIGISGRWDKRRLSYSNEIIKHSRALVSMERLQQMEDIELTVFIMCC